MTSIFADLTRPFKKHGLIFDTAVFASNLLLFNIFPLLSDELSKGAVVGLLATAVFAQLMGAFWKRPYLQQRLHEYKRTAQEGCATNFMYGLLLFHFILFTVSIVMVLATVGIYDVSPGANPNDVWMVLAFVVAGVTTGVVWWAGKRPSANEISDQIPEIGRRNGEYLADALLWLSVAILTQFYWQSLVTEIETGAGSGFSGTGIILFVSMSLLFIFFYLPARYLYFVEDYHSPLTWVQAWLAMLPVVWHIFVG